MNRSKYTSSKRHTLLASLVAAFALSLGAAPIQAQTSIIVAQASDIRSFDPQRVGNTISEAIAINIYDYLIMRDGNGVPQPSLATAWEPAGDTAWRLWLRDDVLWHDGERFTDEDVKFTLERAARDPESVYLSTFEIINEVEIVNDFEVIIHTDEPDPILLSRINRTGAGIMPAHHADRLPELAVSPIGTGPYRFVEWSRDEYVHLEAFPDHWRGAPHYDELTFRVIPEASTRVNELITGGVHIATNVPPADAPNINNSGVAVVLPHATGRAMVLQVNTAADSVTGDPRVREAIDLSIDNQLLIDVLHDGYGTPTRLRISQGVVAPEELYGQYLYDPERAAELLLEAGYSFGEARITLQGTVSRYPQDSQTAELLAVMLASVGFTVELELLEWGVFQDRVRFKHVEKLALDGLGISTLDAWIALRGSICEREYITAT